ncbi:MAG: hypothetical protein ABSC14_08770 [Desulfomonilia bacterium]
MFCCVLIQRLKFSLVISWICVAVTLSGTVFAEDRLLPLDLSSVPEQTRSQLPLPYGLSVNYTYVSEDLDIRKFDLQVDGQRLPSSLVSLDSLHQRTQAETVRIDAWLMSFLDLYGIGGFVNGTAKHLDININQAQFASLPPSFQKLLPQDILSPGFSIDYHGTVYGFGGMLGGGYGPFFYSYDVNYTWTNINRLKTSVDTLIQEIRVQYKMDAFGNKVSVYTGASNEDIKARQSGTYDLNGTHLEFSLEARSAHPWNALIGTEVEFTPHWNLTLEDGFSGRNQITSSLGYRF